MRKLRSKVLLTVFALLLSLTLLLGPGCITIETPESPVSPAPTEPSATPTPIDTSWTPPQTANQTEELPSIADVVALVKPSVVAITTEVVGQSIFGRFTQEGAGSGWIIDEDGIIVTNNHVVVDAQTITVTLEDGRTFPVDTNSIFTDELNDLAIFRIEAHDLSALKIGDSSTLRVGDWVIAIGNALGLGIRATEGIVSRKGVPIPLDQGQTLYDLIETTAVINPGNSGGPLVNLAGEVIGITSAKIAQIGVEGMGYAISIDTAMPIIQELVNKGYVVRPWLGVGLYTVDQLAIRQLKLAVDEGVLLVEVVSDGPAAQAGLKPGDVIVELGGENVTDVEQLTHVLHKSQIGEPLDMVFWRDDARKTTQVTPIESPAPS